MIGVLVAVELVLGEQLAHLQLDQLEQLRIVDHVDLVEEHDHVGHLDLARQQDVLARLGHRAVGAATTRMAPSICAAPVIMFLM